MEQLRSDLGIQKELPGKHEPVCVQEWGLGIYLLCTVCIFSMWIILTRLATAATHQTKYEHAQMILFNVVGICLLKASNVLI